MGKETEEIRKIKSGGPDWFWFLFPSLLLMVLFFFLPVVITFIISGTNMSSSTGFHAWKWVGFNNFRKIAILPETAGHFWLTVKYVAVTLVFFNIGMALVVSIITTHISRGTGFFFRALWLLPRITPTVTYILMWKFLGANAPYGVFNQLVIQPLGLTPQNWVPAASFLFIVLVNGYIGASFGMIIFTSAIEAIPKDITIASLVDGASMLQRIRYIILPYIKWPMLFVTTYQTLSLMTSFEQIMVLTNGEFNTEVWSLWAYHRALQNYWGNFQWGFGNALAAVLVVIGIILGIIYLRYFKFNELVQEPKIESL